MNRKSILIILAAIIICGLLGPVCAGEIEKVTVVGGLAGIPEKVLTAKGQLMSREGTILILNVQAKNITVKNLIACLQALDAQIDAIAQNINYVRNIHYVIYNEDPLLKYKRQVIFVDDKGNVSIKDVASQEMFYTYDPENPLAIREEGKWKGYVGLPYIDFFKEITTLTAAVMQYRTIGNIIRTLDPSVFFKDPEIVLNTLNAFLAPEVLSNALNIISKKLSK